MLLKAQGKLGEAEPLLPVPLGAGGVARGAGGAAPGNILVVAGKDMIMKRTLREKKKPIPTKLWMEITRFIGDPIAWRTWSWKQTAQTSDAGALSIG